MAQSIILKRSAVSGRVPDTGSINLGEIAINTYDGKLYFRKSGSSQSVEHIVTTNSTTTGSITITGTGSFGEIFVTTDINVTGSGYFIGDIVGNSDLDVLGSISGSSARITGTGSFASLKVNDTLTVNHGTTIISGSQTITSDLTVLGAVNARQFNISIISSSTIYQSGSTKFGDTIDDTHQFTGSVSVTGSVRVNNTLYVGTYTTESTEAALVVGPGSNGGVGEGGQIILQSGTNYTSASMIDTYQNKFRVLRGTNSNSDAYKLQVDLHTGQLQIPNYNSSNAFSGSSVAILGVDNNGFVITTTAGGASSGPNTFDFNLDPNAAGTVNYIEDSTGNTQVIARANSMDVLFNSATAVSISASAFNVTTGSITSNYYHLAKYISSNGDLDFNV